MSWWDTPRGHVLGDGPADIVQRALQAPRDPRPTLPELLAALGDALEQPGLVARLEDAPDVPAAPAPPPGGLAADLRRTVEQVRAEYRTALKREPETAEILETFQFILAYLPERYLTGAEGIEILAIEL